MSEELENDRDPEKNDDHYIAPKQEIAEARPPNAVKMPALTLGDNFGMTVFGGSEAFALAQRMANALAHSTLVPLEYQLVYQKGDKWFDNPNALGNCIIALEIATRLHLSPMMVMQNMDVIHGRPGFRGAFLAGLVNQSPLFSRLRYQWTDDVEKGQDDYGCRAYATDRETGEVVYGAWITWKMVRKEGWSTKTGSKWLTMDEQMFMYRAATFWVRVHAPDLLLGMQTTEELEDIAPALEYGSGRRASLQELNERLDAGGSDAGDAGEHATADPTATATADPTAHAADKPAAGRRRKASVKREPLEQAEPETKPETQTVAPAAIDGDAAGTPEVETNTPDATPAASTDSSDMFNVE